MKNKDKIILVIVCMALYALAGSLERGWWDFRGLAALSTLIVPMTIIWIKEEGRND